MTTGTRPEDDRTTVGAVGRPRTSGPLPLVGIRPDSLPSADARRPGGSTPTRAFPSPRGPTFRRATTAPEEEYHHIRVAEQAKKLVDQGNTVQIGAHGQLQGLAAHWEVWMLEQGGMTPHEALRSATLHGARYLGMDGDLGSLEPGKLADLVVIDGNPLVDLRRSADVTHVMVNGRLFDAPTMDEIGGLERERRPFWWQRDGLDDSFIWGGPGL